MSAYVREIVCYFKVKDYTFRITHCSGDDYYIEETRCNGQEDTHMNATVGKEGGKFVFEDNEWTFNHFAMYGTDGLGEAVLDFLNEHGAPEVN